MKLITILFLLFITFSPITAKAQNANLTYFSVNCVIGNHEDIAPNDYFHDTFTIENQSSGCIEIRVSEIANIENSKLYPVLKAGWGDLSDSDTLSSLEELSTDWYLIKPGESLDLDLTIYFPGYLGNEYQKATLKARFTFECRISESADLKINTTSRPNHLAVVTIPATCDSSRIGTPILLCIFSGLFTIYIRGTKGVKNYDEN